MLGSASHLETPPAGVHLHKEVGTSVPRCQSFRDGLCGDAAGRRVIHRWPCRLSGVAPLCPRRLLDSAVGEWAPGGPRGSRGQDSGSAGVEAGGRSGSRQHQREREGMGDPPSWDPSPWAACRLPLTADSWARPRAWCLAHGGRGGASVSV